MKAKIRFGILGAFVALAGALGVAGSGSLATPVDAQIPAGLSVTRTCNATTININTSTICTTTITANAATNVNEPIVLTTTNGATSGTGANPEYGRALLLAGGSGATGGIVDTVTVTNPTNGLNQTITVNCFGVNPNACAFPAAPAPGSQIVITESLQGVVGGPTSTTISFGGGTPVALAPAVTVQSATVTATGTCNPATLVAGSGANSVCTVDFNDNDLFPTVVSSANVTATIIGPAGVVFAGNGTTTTSVGCGNTQNAPQSCDTVALTLTSTVPGVSGNVNLLINYVSDLPAVDFPNVFTLNNVLAINAVGPVAAFVQPAGLRITCPSTTDAFAPQGVPIAIPTPGQLGALNIIALGVLPSTLICTVQGIDAAGAVLAAFAPGIIEVSSVQGTLIDAAGRLATNLRIGCDNRDTTTVVLGQTINPNTCTGVSFGVIGQGVGIVEIRAEYEPNAIPQAAGILNRQTLANVGFIAPVIVPNLLLSPNPVVVGATGTATVRFNRTGNCSAAFGGLNFQGGNTCIDPTTGAPIFFNIGSSLNGNVVLTIANNAHAAWAEAVTASPLTSPAVAGFTATAAQVVRRCGNFPTSAIVSTLGQVPSTTGPLASFFGGCETVNAVYRGVLPGVTNITATFVPDLPGAFGQAVGVTGSTAALLGLFGSGTGAFATSQRVLEVVAAPPSGVVNLVRGCNNVSPTVTEGAAAYAARVAPAGALVALWEHQASNNTFRGFSPTPGAPSDLSGSTRLRPLFVCVNNAATLDQPAA